MAVEISFDADSLTVADFGGQTAFETSSAYPTALKVGGKTSGSTDRVVGQPTASFLKSLSVSESNLTSADVVITGKIYRKNATEGEFAYFGARCPDAATDTWVGGGHRQGSGWEVVTCVNGTRTRLAYTDLANLADGSYDVRVTIQGETVKLEVYETGTWVEKASATQSTVSAVGRAALAEYIGVLQGGFTYVSYGYFFETGSWDTIPADVSEPAMRWIGSIGYGGSRGTGSSPTNSTG